MIFSAHCKSKIIHQKSQTSSRHHRDQFHRIALPQDIIVGDQLAVDRYQDAFGVNADFFQRVARGDIFLDLELFIAKRNFNHGESL